MALYCKLISGSELVWNKPVDQVILPTTTGRMGILKGHATTITALDIGVLAIRRNQAWEPIVILNGVAQIKNNLVTVVALEVEQVTKEDYEKSLNRLNEAIEKVSSAQTMREKMTSAKELQLARARFEVFKYLDYSD